VLPMAICMRMQPVRSEIRPHLGVTPCLRQYRQNPDTGWSSSTGLDPAARSAIAMSMQPASSNIAARFGPDSKCPPLPVALATLTVRDLMRLLERHLTWTVRVISQDVLAECRWPLLDTII